MCFLKPRGPVFRFLFLEFMQNANVYLLFGGSWSFSCCSVWAVCRQMTVMFDIFSCDLCFWSNCQTDYIFHALSAEAHIHISALLLCIQPCFVSLAALYESPFVVLMPCRLFPRADGSSGAHGTNPTHRHLLSGEQTFHSIRFLQVPPTHRGPIPGRPEQPGTCEVFVLLRVAQERR